MTIVIAYCLELMIATCLSCKGFKIWHAEQFMDCENMTESHQ